MIDPLGGEEPEVAAAADRFVVLTGASGGGKSTLLAELARRGFQTVPEPGRRIVEQERASGGSALPWIDLAAFARRAIGMAITDRRAAAETFDRTKPGWIFFDRGLVDAAAALQHATGERALDEFGRRHRYHRHVFLAPPWPEIYGTDADRRHGLDAALAEYERLAACYPALGYEIVLLPKVSVAERADFILERLGRPD